ncbi:TPA: helix-turn-helix domain-containing protein [Pseudomonas putida]
MSPIPNSSATHKKTAAPKATSAKDASSTKKPAIKRTGSDSTASDATPEQVVRKKRSSAKETVSTDTESTDASSPAKPRKSKKAPAEDKSIVDRWGKDLTAAGWTAIPNVLFEYSQELGLKSHHIVIILHLAGYWWRKGNDPFPSKATLARKIGVDSRTIQRAIAELERKGYIERNQRFASSGGNLSNSYSFDGLIKEARTYAKQMIVERGAKAVATTRKKPATSRVKASQ